MFDINAEPGMDGYFDPNDIEFESEEEMHHFWRGQTEVLFDIGIDFKN